MSDTIITNVRGLEPGVGVVAAWLRIRQGTIVELGSPGTAPPAEGMRAQIPADLPARAGAGTKHVDGGGRLLTPGLIDIHTHGIEQFAYETAPEQLVAGTQRLAQYGTTCILPTLYRSVSREWLGELERFAAALATVENTCVPGLHLEGPFLALPGGGCQTFPGDLGLLGELWAAADGKLAAMSVSPEVQDILPVIERLCELAIVPIITHTRATVEQTQAAIDAGARHATHFYDVFPVPQEVDPGVRPVGAVETILADPRCSVDFVADGVHVHPTAIRAVLAAKGFRNIMLTTDSNVGAGWPPGTYDWPLGKIITGNAARIHRPGSPLDGALAGSTLTTDRGMANLLAWLELPEEQVWAMGTSNVARILRLSVKGSLKVGADADLVLWEQDAGQLQAVRTWVAGRLVHVSNT
jgi:N-acetylglucosamine-6-phosphate deacetylase